MHAFFGKYEGRFPWEMLMLQWPGSSCENLRPHSLHLALAQLHRKMHVFLGQYEERSLWESLEILRVQELLKAMLLLNCPNPRILQELLKTMLLLNCSDPQSLHHPVVILLVWHLCLKNPDRLICYLLVFFNFI